MANTTRPSPNPTSQLIVQDALPSDVDAIARIGAQTFEKSFGYSMPAEHLAAYLTTSYSPAAIAAELADTTHNRFFVARQAPTQAETGGASASAGAVVGFAQMKLGTSEPCLPVGVPACELHRIYVSLDHVSGGVGHVLMQRALEWARETWPLPVLQQQQQQRDDGAERTMAAVWLGVWEENVKAQRFYQRYGFERIGHHDFVMGDTTQTDWVLIKYL